MGQHGDRAREALLDSAEELFARHGIDVVSNRSIAEHAGSANHSAVAYHFGGREGLLQALLARGRDDMNRRRAELVEALPERPGLGDVVAAHILPWTEHLESLPVPSWRARFLFQVSSVPSGAESLEASTVRSDQLEEVLTASLDELRDIPDSVLRGRARLLGGMVLGICANFEAQVEDGTARGSWLTVGYFLIDAATGLLSAPVTHPTDFITLDPPSAFAL